MEQALIVSSNEKSAEALREMLSKESFDQIVTVKTAGEARRLLVENDYALCVINAPLPDEYGEGLSVSIAQNNLGSVILLCKAEIFEECSAKVEDYGVIAVSKPINRMFLWNAIKLATVSYKRMQHINHENKKLLQKIEDIRLVDRAKCLLISCLAMSEPEAHKYIEKQAMDLRISRRAVAEEILKTYEN